MFPAKLIKTCSLALIMTAVLWSGFTCENTAKFTSPLQHAGGLARAQDRDGSGTVNGPNLETMNVEDLSALTIDLAGYHACERLEDHILTLSSAGAATPADRRTVTGNFWVDDCKMQEVDSRQLGFTVSGQGWRWISHQEKNLGAEFELDQYVKFSAHVSMVGTFDVAYAEQDHIATIWFVPTRPVEVDFEVLGDVNVDTGSLWSSIVGQGAEILGESPEERALADIRQKGARKFRSRLSSGLTLIIDLCTGQRFIKFGTFPAGQLPDQASRSQGVPTLAHNHAVLHAGGILMSGPFDAGEPVIARVDVRKGGAVRATMVCQEDARRIADAYKSGSVLPEVEALADATALPGSAGRLEVPPGAGCPLVLVMRPVDERDTPLSFSFQVYHEGAERKPLVKCD